MTQDPFDLTGKVAIVTGSTKGMGVTIAETFAAHGARVLVTSRNAAEAAEMAERLNAEYGAGRRIAISQAGSLDSKSDQQAIVDAAVAAFGTVTTLVCSPTMRPWFGSAIDTPDEEIDRQFLYVFKTRFWITSMCIPHMARSGGGSVVYIGSGSAFEATAERSIYACMRAAEVQLVKNFAAEFGQNNIRFNVVSPGLIDAHGSKALFEDMKAVAEITAGMPMRRHGTTSEIAQAVTFLASEASSFTTGVVLPVDGGRLTHAVKSRLSNAFAKEQSERLGQPSGGGRG